MFRLLDLLKLESSSADTRLLKALDVVHQHQRSRRKVLTVTLDLGFASQRWQAFVQQRQDGEVLLDRHALELCVFMYLAEALQSGDLYVAGSGAYDDYRAQLLPWDECDRRLDDYGAAVKLRRGPASLFPSYETSWKSWPGPSTPASRTTARCGSIRMERRI